MKTFISSSCMAVIIAVVFLTSCKKDSSSPSGSSSAQMEFGIKSDNAATNLASNVTTNSLATTATPGIVWTSGIANISSFKLEAKKNGIETEIRSKTLENVDLFAAIPKLVNAVVDTGTYSEIELRVMLSKSSGTDIPLRLKGAFTSAGGAVVPIELDFNEDVTIKAEVENVTVTGTQDLTSTITLHLNKLLANITAADIDAADRSNGTIIINGTLNNRIYIKIKDNIMLSITHNGFEKHKRGKN